MTSAHVDFEVIGEFAIPADEVGGTQWIATGIITPAETIEALVAQVGPFRTAVFRASRIQDLDPSVAGEVPTDPAARLPLSEIGVSGLTALTAYIGHTADSELLVSTTQFRVGQVVRLYHLVPAEIGAAELVDALLTRLLPTPTAEQAGYRVEVNADGSGFDLVEARAADDLPSNVYATPAQYSARSGAGSEVGEDLLTEILDAASRHIDRRLNVVPGHFAPVANETRVFNGTGSEILRLRDGGLGHALRSVVAGGVRPDFDLTGRYDGYAWDLDDVWLWGLPENAAARGEPYTALELRRLQAAPLTIWPYNGGSVEIEGAWGWGSTPPPIREFAVSVARDFRDAQRGGAAARVQDFDDTVIYSDRSWRMWRDITREYGARRGLVGTRSR